MPDLVQESLDTVELFGHRSSLHIVRWPSSMSTDGCDTMERSHATTQTLTCHGSERTRVSTRGTPRHVEGSAGFARCPASGRGDRGRKLPRLGRVLACPLWPEVAPQVLGTRPREVGKACWSGDHLSHGSLTVVSPGEPEDERRPQGGRAVAPRQRALIYRERGVRQSAEGQVCPVSVGA